MLSVFKFFSFDWFPTVFQQNPEGISGETRIETEYRAIDALSAL